VRLDSTRVLYAGHRQRETDHTARGPAGGDCIRLMVRCPVAPASLRPSSVAGCALILGMVMSLGGVSLPQTTLVVYGSLALMGLLLVWPVHWPGWTALVLVAVSTLYHGSYAAGVLRQSVALR